VTCKYLPLALLVALAGCSKPLPCVFNDTPECDARWRPYMEGREAPQYDPTADALILSGAGLLNRTVPPPLAPPAPPRTYDCDVTRQTGGAAVSCR
jgi:hypothetical protein